MSNPAFRRNDKENVIYLSFGHLTGGVGGVQVK